SPAGRLAGTPTQVWGAPGSASGEWPRPGRTRPRPVLPPDRGPRVVKQEPGSAHMRVAVVHRRDEQLLDGAGVHPPDQVEDRPGLVVGAAGPRPAERLLPDDRTG